MVSKFEFEGLFLGVMGLLLLTGETSDRWLIRLSINKRLRIPKCQDLPLHLSIVIGEIIRRDRTMSFQCLPNIHLFAFATRFDQRLLNGILQQIILIFECQLAPIITSLVDVIHRYVETSIIDHATESFIFLYIRDMLDWCLQSEYIAECDTSIQEIEQRNLNFNGKTRWQLHCNEVFQLGHMWTCHCRHQIQYGKHLLLQFYWEVFAQPQCGFKSLNLKRYSEYTVRSLTGECSHTFSLIFRGLPTSRPHRLTSEKYSSAVTGLPAT